ncbi:peptide MFS transporter [Phenylobacterium sp.]|uniref:peptide MFS transporter n=1 Tax=Phenylobacterium sp. TaxID=1871053 RepID=UPI0025E5EC9F|nr:peptide MFS transporter [Phenylobacterium sp.]
MSRSGVAGAAVAVARRSIGAGLLRGAGSSVGPAAEREWFGHPAGLSVLFLTETWERFSYIAIRVLLVYYMVKGLGFHPAKASMIYGLYSGFAYLTPIVGGILSDRWLGARRSVILGCSIMALGHFMMISEALFYPALAAICFGNGLFLPNLLSQVRQIYKPGDPRGASAYNVYYVGANLGALLAPIVCGYLGETYGWHYGFAAAGVGMLIGIGIYAGGARHLPVEQPPAVHIAVQATPAWRADTATRFRLLGAVAVLMVLFRTAYEQIGNTVALWADEGVDRSLGALTIPMTWLQAINPLLVCFAMPLVILTWTRLRAAGREPDALAKMAIGCAGLAAAYLMLAAVAAVAGPGTKVSWVWIAAYITLLTLAEMWVFPIGMSLFGRLAPLGLGATTMAVWGLGSFAGNFMGGLVGTLWTRIDHATFFALIATLPALAAVLFLALGRPARKIEDAAALAAAAT